MPGGCSDHPDAVPLAFVFNSFHSLADQDAEQECYCGSVIDDEFEEAPIHRVGDSREMKKAAMRERSAWRKVKLCDFDNYLKTCCVLSNNENCDSTCTNNQSKSSPPHVVVVESVNAHTVEADHMKTTAQICAASAKKGQYHSNGRREHRMVERRSDETHSEGVEHGHYDESYPQLDTATPSLLDMEPEDVEFRQLLLSRVFRVEATPLPRQPLRSTQPGFGDLRYQCVPYQCFFL